MSPSAEPTMPAAPVVTQTKPADTPSPAVVADNPANDSDMLSTILANFVLPDTYCWHPDSVKVGDKYNVGAGIKALVRKLRKNGISLGVNLPESDSEEDAPEKPKPKKKQDPKDLSISAELLQVWWLIPLGITNAIARGKAKPESIATPIASSAAKKISGGQIVALYIPKDQTILSCPKDSELAAIPAKKGQVTLKQEDARFLVVDAGNDMIAFYHPRHRKFLMIDEGGNLGISPLPVVSMDDEPRGHESFYFTESKDGTVNLKCPYSKKAGTYNATDQFQIMNIEGFQ